MPSHWQKRVNNGAPRMRVPSDWQLFVQLLMGELAGRRRRNGADAPNDLTDFSRPLMTDSTMRCTAWINVTVASSRPSVAWLYTHTRVWESQVTAPNNPPSIIIFRDLAVEYKRDESTNFALPTQFASNKSAPNVSIIIYPPPLLSLFFTAIHDKLHFTAAMINQ